MSFDTYFGWDIGGAHLKVASIDRHGSVNFAKQLATPLWKGLDSLEQAMSKIQNEILDRSVTHTFTMTAELADIFKDRDSGVKALTNFLGSQFNDDHYHLYAGKEGLIKANQADFHISDIASANWHATASFVAQHTGEGVLIDIGSTTTDIIPFASGQLINIAYSDNERLRQDELVYTGIIRTPVMAVVNKMLCEGQWQNIAAENFSTMADIYRLSGELNEQDDMMPTADNAGKTQSDSARRLLRMVGLDHFDENNTDSAIDMAKQIATTQLEKINESLVKVLSRNEAKKTNCLIGAGAGRFLVPKLAEKNNLPYIDFTDLLSYQEGDEYNVLSCAAAVSVAQLSRAVR
ncbi:MAG: putative H4MPT-linked C1 transfer pathway protein [Gammaproteobacteria bacterium]|jgi:probable H4MPT-linked C1 transfer pathway protein